MKLEKILSYLEAVAPGTFQEVYDNSGLILGNTNAEITKVQVCLDTDKNALKHAIENKCQLIVSHHPLVFKAMKSFTDDIKEAAILIEAIKNDIALYSSHTNFDSVNGGLTDLISKRLGLVNINVIKKGIFEDSGVGRYGEVHPVTPENFIKLLKSILKLDVVRVIGKNPKKIIKVAVFNGSYDRGILEELSYIKPDVLITGDVKYHDAQELIYNRIYTIDAGHYGTEKLFVEEMARILETKFPNLDVIRYEGEDVFRYC